MYHNIILKKRRLQIFSFKIITNYSGAPSVLLLKTEFLCYICTTCDKLYCCRTSVILYHI